MPLNSYSEVQQFINQILSRNISEQTGAPEIRDVPNSPHGAFWDLTYDEFINGDVPNVHDPDTGASMKILVVGNSAASNLIRALRGTSGTAFDPQTGGIGQMPANGPPMFTPSEIYELADWIDRCCPP